MKNKLRKINKILARFNLQLRKENYFIRESTKQLMRTSKKDMICIEIGVYKGINAYYLLKNCNIKTLYLIDSYNDYKENTKEENKQRIIDDKTYEIAKKRLNKFGKKVRFIRKTSKEAINLFKDNSIDFIYIDGNHAYKYVKEDIKLYYPKLKKGGIIAGDDINLPDVFRAVSEFCVGNKLNCKIKYEDWVVIK